ncbi:transposase [Streptomyces sp. NPDC005181]|uniref:transposase n=1 Tax=Streptomyces sp. NPDC005181 TaxID=3156869 RepID=UPI0033A38147
MTDVARELGISSESLRGWVKKARAAEAAPVAEDRGRRHHLLRRRFGRTAGRGFPGRPYPRPRLAR